MIQSVQNMGIVLIVQFHMIVNAIDAVKYFSKGDLKEAILCLLLIIIDIIITIIQIKVVRELQAIASISNLVKPFIEKDSVELVNGTKENE